MSSQRKLPLLGPAFEGQTAQEFAARVSAMRRAPQRKAPVKPKKTMLKGKRLRQPSKRKDGEYRITYGKEEIILTHSSQEISTTQFSALCQALKCPRMELARFLETKNFTLQKDQTDG